MSPFKNSVSLCKCNYNLSLLKLIQVCCYACFSLLSFMFCYFFEMHRFGSLHMFSRFYFILLVAVYLLSLLLRCRFEPHLGFELLGYFPVSIFLSIWLATSSASSASGAAAAPLGSPHHKQQISLAARRHHKQQISSGTFVFDTN